MHLGLRKAMNFKSLDFKSPGFIDGGYLTKVQATFF